jgi:hypothetical protein
MFSKSCSGTQKSIFIIPFSPLPVEFCCFGYFKKIIAFLSKSAKKKRYPARRKLAGYLFLINIAF